MKINDESKFDFWFPVAIGNEEENFEKANKDKDEKSIDRENMFVSGIASTEDIDLDSQIMKANGMNIDYLLNRGFVNWHHQSKTEPMAVIGEPVEAKIVNNPNGMFVKAKLYNTPMACDAYDLALMLQKQSKTRRLGFSVEGKVIEKSGTNIITKSIITGIALTHSPKNYNTFADIAKAMVDGSTTENILEKSQIHFDNGSKFVFETNTSIITFDKNGNLHFIEKAIDTGTAGILSRESLEGGMKLTKPNLNEVLEKIFNKYPDITFQKAIKVANIVLENLEN